MKIILDRDKCIGCGACTALCPKYFEMEEDGKSSLKGAKTKPKTQIEELTIKKLDCSQDAADICPVKAININS